MPSFSQNATDTTVVVLSNDIARLIIQDLIAGDAAKKEVEILRNKIELQDQKIFSQEEIILRLNTQIDNLELVEVNRKDQLDNYEELTTRLEKDNKKLENVVKIFKATTGVGMVAVLVLVTVI